ncbi:hypothetical protein PVT67_14460 [Gallaecimonas kandeliae]|uniref:MauE/DoxX family redox-associated membrane protein n=1 Tax=Gallaecimonas kandeliae TaxID=3029055 RepID=UPI0026493C79|nr:MauE/DoxX family redox-associated membrane protein [Gallaecimonas kandeliae]WKE64856.1 hypothetical protein PVT67_14460 [Gallaecimonas kandeliae]
MAETDVLALLARLLAGLFFGFSALGKGRALNAFSQNLVDSFGVPAALAGAASWTLVAFEALLALALLGSWTYRCAAMALAFLALAAFTALVAWRHVQEGNLRCHCFGTSDRPLSRFDIARNLLLLAAIGAYLVTGGESHTPAPVELAVLGALALVLVQWLIHFHETLETLFYQGRRPAP